MNLFNLFSFLLQCHMTLISTGHIPITWKMIEKSARPYRTERSGGVVNRTHSNIVENVRKVQLPAWPQVGRSFQPDTFSTNSKSGEVLQSPACRQALLLLNDINSEFPVTIETIAATGTIVTPTSSPQGRYRQQHYCAYESQCSNNNPYREIFYQKKYWHADHDPHQDKRYDFAA